MAAFPQLRILHISDLHFGPKHICNSPDPSASKKGIPTLSELICRDATTLNWNVLNARSTATVRDSGESLPQVPFIVAVTGDITEKASDTQFADAYSCLRELVASKPFSSNGDLRNLFIVPGNHDVLFDRPEPEQRFGPYSLFYNKLFREIQPQFRGFCRPDDVGSLNQLHLFPEASFLIAEINSCLYVEKETEDETRGQVDFEAIKGLRQQLTKVGKQTRDWIRVALVHHHPILSPALVEPGRGYDSIVNANSLLRLLRDHGFHLILHGHKHFPQVFTYDPASAWSSGNNAVPQLIVAGGSAGSSVLPKGRGRCNSYNLITVKWNPTAHDARIQVVTRGLILDGPDGALDPDQWHWQTLRIFDKMLRPDPDTLQENSFERVSPPSRSDTAETARKNEYARLRHNMPVVEVMVSLMSGQSYEARTWLVPHRYHHESPIRVTWSAGPKFDRKICNSASAPDFAASFHYWGPMLVQCELEFADGKKEYAYLYARLPQSARH
jgi:3',5'-cyclic AMP phosphodiesterase CpdA